MEEELKTFSKTLKSLVTNDKYIINTLSVLAMNAKENRNLAKEISKMALSHIFKVPEKLKLISFYVVDSIIKNVGSPYKEMFSEKIVDTFVHTFQSNKDHDVRLKLYNLRITWKQQFPPNLMNQLDEQIKKLDPAWPLVLQCDPKYKQALEKQKTSSENSSAKSSPDSTTPTVNKDPRPIQKIKSEPEIGQKRKSEDLFTIDRTGDDKIKKRLIDNIKSEEETHEFIGKKDLDLRITTPQQQTKDELSDVKECQPPNKNWTPDEIVRYLSKNKPSSNHTSRENTPPINYSKMHSRYHLMPREPTWKICIEGFPQFPQIGTDPRLLCPCPFFDPHRSITIDGTKYLLHLERIQPCIFVNNELHAVRFYCQSLEVHINNIPYELSSVHLTHIKINRRAYVACLGGPGHELIINGWPYNVRIDGNIHQITVSNYPVSVQFLIHRQIQVNVQNSIPPYIYDWADKGFFGSPQYLNMSPLNPLKNPKLQDPQAFRFRYELNVMHLNRSNSHTQMPPPASVGITNNSQYLADKIVTSHVISNQTPANLVPTSSNSSGDSNKPTIDVHDLFQKLLATGIISPNKSKDLKLDITKYSWELFKVLNEKEINEMCSGHQCDLCGTRFKNKESKEFELHLDYHFYKNTANLTINKVSRNYLAGSRQWVIGSSVRSVEPDFDFEQTSNSEQKFKCPAFDDADLNKCAVCMEGFEVNWDDEEERFMLLDGQLHNDKVYHPICLEDADKQLENNSGQLETKAELIANHPLAALQSVLNGGQSDEKIENIDNITSNDFEYESGQMILTDNANSTTALTNVTSSIITSSVTTTTASDQVDESLTN